jgi:hypothetical protein
MDDRPRKEMSFSLSQWGLGVGVGVGVRVGVGVAVGVVVGAGVLVGFVPPLPEHQGLLEQRAWGTQVSPQ